MNNEILTFYNRNDYARHYPELCDVEICFHVKQCLHVAMHMICHFEEKIFNLYSAVPTAQNVLINFAHYQEINNRLTEIFPLLYYARSLISVTVYALSCLLRIKQNTLQVICLCLKEYRWSTEPLEKP